MVGRARVGIPTGVVSLLFTDIEGSTRLLHELGAVYGDLLAEHHRVLREVWAAHSGVEISTEGDAFFVAFATPAFGVAAALAAQRILTAHSWPGGRELRVRMGLHTGSPQVRGEEYWGLDVHYAARLCSAAHGGQILVSGATAALIDIALEDLGEHALKDFPSPRRLFSVPSEGRSGTDFPPPRTVSTGQTNLPDELTSFIGRDRELAELLRLTESERLITLTGAGGVGKTRLALRLGAELLDGSGDGVWLIELAEVSEPALVAARVGDSLGLAVSAGSDPVVALCDALARRRMVLILDNCEHLLGSVAALAVAMLERCREIVILVTSRQPLRVAAEWVHRLPSLSTPLEQETRLEKIAQSEAVQLLLRRAAQHRPGFALTSDNAVALAETCRRLDGIPLAIELAAARLRSLSARDLNVRLDHRLTLLTGGARTALPRQQTLRALIDWSYELLTHDEQQALLRLSVFAASGFDLAAAEAVCGGPQIEEWRVLDLLDALVDKSLVQAEDAGATVRYRLLETVREYAMGILEGDDAALSSVLHAHLNHYVMLAEQASPELPRARRKEWMARLSLEQGNLRRALSTSIADEDAGPGLRIAICLRRFWLARGLHAEGIAVTRKLLARAGLRTRERGEALCVLSQLTIESSGDVDHAVADVEQARNIGLELRDEPLIVRALALLSFCLLERDDPAGVLATAEEALAHARALGDIDLLHLALNGHAIARAVNSEDPVPDFTEAATLSRANGDVFSTATVLFNLGVLAVSSGDTSTARARIEEALEIFRSLDQPADIAHSELCLGFVHCTAGEITAARPLFAAAVRVGDRIANRRLISFGLLGAALSATAPDIAARLHGAADAAIDRTGLSVDPFIETLRLNDRTSRAHSLDAHESERLSAEGQTMDEATAIAIAIDALA